MRIFAVGLLVCSALLGQDFDVLIRGGKIVDGTGSFWYYADLGIRGDSIAAIGLLRDKAAKTTIEAKGLVVAPGFIDIHTHSRIGIFRHPEAENYLRQGVTTVIEGNDGSSPLPLAPFLERLSKTPLGLNFASFVGQGSIRQEVMGLAARKSTAGEVAKMKDIVKQAMLDGAFGMSTGLFYVPGNFTPMEEVVELAKVAGEYGGMHISHMRSEGDKVLDAVAETIRIGEEGHLPTQVTHHKIIGAASWGKSTDSLALIEAARARGVDVTVDAYPYTASSTGTAAMFPQLALEGGQKALLERLAAPERRAEIKAEIARRIQFDRGGGDPKNVVMASCGFDHALDGKSLAEITKDRNRVVNFANAAETAIELQSQGGCSAIYHAISEEDVERILRYPFTMVGSDGEIPTLGAGVPHPRSYGTFARVLGRYVRERKTITLEDAVHKMSGLPAVRLRMFDRGFLLPGLKADVVLFDPATVADRATFEKPHQYAVGFRWVIVNGTPVIADGKLNAARPGRVLYGPAKK
ncbi:N-acyl-D-amino-acid deacylase family protein [Bryobacter aggregatus]|uniref:N-acyl-D-amino-acid deacylase family protein n=1 Tax=Bryobacter aggregatus TaxID=360054 RepID=UPI0004E19827|nr:D-aminoacylase [Bryobacter aggregatus]